MTNLNLHQMTVEQLVQRFAEDGVGQDRALLYDETDQFNDLMKEINAIDSELESRGHEACLALLKLYGHPNIQVRLQAARATLSIAPIAARNEIEAIANSRHFPQAGDAGMTLSFLNRTSKL
jgi:hypothetical protein